ncbi:hypothetical protein [Streptomyces sp. NPDC091278]|uniref:hypothetical protein n=1 Tax=Streptomyces sp. NPDC091278 TaxID=3155301 RepID=UPI00344D0B54
MDVSLLTVRVGDYLAHEDEDIWLKIVDLRQSQRGGKSAVIEGVYATAVLLPSGTFKVMRPL